MHHSFQPAIQMIMFAWSGWNLVLFTFGQACVQGRACVPPGTYFGMGAKNEIRDNPVQAAARTAERRVHDLGKHRVHSPEL